MLRDSAECLFCRCREGRKNVGGVRSAQRVVLFRYPCLPRIRCTFASTLQPGRGFRGEGLTPIHSRRLAFELREAIVSAGKKHGFAYVTLDLQGYRLGSHNEVLVGKNLRIL